MRHEKSMKVASQLLNNEMGQLVHMSNRDGDGWKPLIYKRLVSFLFFY